MLTASDLPELRKAFGLTQTGMAELLGIHLRSYQDIEAGKVVFKTMHRLAIERALLPLAGSEDLARLLPAALRTDILAVATLLKSA
ncbi:helix-turn-helix transcriptional regulator [Kaistia geumhonensis]|uniref:DNA-binding XRE family transcriptional regulator n=1 Tax=Kaistia geumhonensis TaxID=410839 RepID=A0ABU0M5V5_9HYPH|nr:helix-turn-helix transcriptional regulator [Kaistia geumhonensis]MCX5478465.1 helix-turn-helix transcriptional regulator [Kaistia geumhonensis]MDQ0516317.1 DNA-binding XRE family transcriptional regulator [Kaistia geumhonensis]